MDDITVLCGQGIVNIRVGAIILNGDKILMASNSDVDYLYSVGGRIKFGECAEEAIKREVLEELGVALEIERLGIIHENFFYGSDKKLTYEISLYYYMKMNENDTTFKTENVENDRREFYEWVDSSDKRKMHPNFLYEKAIAPSEGIIHICTDERLKEVK